MFYKIAYNWSVIIQKQGDLDDAPEITAVWCGNVKKKNEFRGGHLGFLVAILD